MLQDVSGMGDRGLGRYQAYWSPTSFYGGHVGAEWRQQFNENVGYHLRTHIGPTWEEGQLMMAVGARGGVDIALDNGFKAGLTTGYTRSARTQQGYDALTDWILSLGCRMCNSNPS